MKALFYLRQCTLLVLFLLLFSGCDSDSSNNSTDEFTRSVADETIAVLEQLANAITNDCGETFSAWEAVDRQFVKNNLSVYRPRFSADQQNRANTALGTIQDTLKRCWPESDFSDPLAAETETTVDCNKMCPISDWHCFVFVMECASGDNQACCFSGACTGNCLDT